MSKIQKSAKEAMRDSLKVNESLMKTYFLQVMDGKVGRSNRDLSERIFDDAWNKARYKCLMKFDDIVDQWIIREAAKAPVMTTHYNSDIYTQIAKTMRMSREEVKPLIMTEPQNFWKDVKGRLYPKKRKLSIRCESPDYFNDLTVYTEDIAGMKPSTYATIQDEDGNDIEFHANSYGSARCLEKDLIVEILEQVGEDKHVEIVVGEKEVEYIVYID